MNKQFAAGLAVILLGAIAVGPLLAADVITRKSTKTPASGTITGSTADGVTIKRGKKEETVPADDIVKIKWDGEPLRLNLSRSKEASGGLKEALEGYTAALKDSKATKKNLRTDLEYLIARTTAKMALADPDQRDTAIKLLSAFRSANSRNFRNYEALFFLGRVYTAKKDFAKAEEAYTQMQQAKSNDYKMAGQIALARVQLAKGDVEPALQSFDKVIAIPAKTPGELARRHEALLGKATCLMKQQQYDQAVAALDQVIDLVSPQETQIQAEAFLRQGDCLQAQGKFKNAILAYLHVDLLFAKERTLHAEALYHLSKLWPRVDQPDRGGDARAKLASEYPNSEWNKRAGS